MPRKPTGKNTHPFPGEIGMFALRDFLFHFKLGPVQVSLSKMSKPCTGSTACLTMTMKFSSLLLALCFLAGCSRAAWKDTGRPGPWCEPGVRAHIFCRTVNSPGMPNPQSEMALAAESEAKETAFSFSHELDLYFGKCVFIKRWPARGTTGAYPTYDPPFDLCMVSMNPMVIMGIERQNPKVSSFGPANTWGPAFISSSYLLEPIAIRTNLPYHSGAKVICFSPAIDNDLHEINLASGTASFAIGNGEQINVFVEGAQLMTSRK